MASKRCTRAIFHLLVLTIALLSLSSIAFADEQQILNPSFDGTLDNIKYEAANKPPSARHIEAKQKLLARLKKEDPDVEVSNIHPRYWLLRALFGYWRHGQRYQQEILKKANIYYAMKDEHRIRIKETSDYEDIYEKVGDRHGVNGAVSQDIAKAAFEYYGIEPRELADFIAVQEYNEEWDNQERVNEALQHIYRDWSREGQHERANASAAITGILEEQFPDRKQEDIKVLFPGSGLGRIPHDVAARGGFEVTANELSSYMRVAYRYMESLSTTNMVTFHPFMDWWSYQPNRYEMIRPVNFPDTIIDKSSVLLVEGDFTKEFVDKPAHFDAIVTFFFMDTAPNMMNYFDTLSTIIKPGGLWVNLGPLLYHEASVEFSLNDMMKVATSYGFEFVNTDEKWGPITLKNQKARTMHMNYMVHEKSLRTNDYKAQLFAAVKKR